MAEPFIPLWDEYGPALLLFGVERSGDTLSANTYAPLKALSEGTRLENADNEGEFYLAPTIPEKQVLDLIIGGVTLWRAES